MSHSAQDVSYTTEEIAQLLKVSKLTVYDLIKKGEIRAYRVGRQMRIDATDLTAYKERLKTGGTIKPRTSPAAQTTDAPAVIISGQDLSLDILASYIEEAAIGYRPLRSFSGSLNNLVKLYEGQADIVSTHLFDGATGSYNLPYVTRLLTGRSYIVIHLLKRQAGLYVQKGNPKQLTCWEDLAAPGIRLINREIGSGARILLDDQLRLANISGPSLAGYADVELNHMAIATRIAAKQADVGVGIEKTAQLLAIDFIPLIEESYDLVLLKTAANERLRDFLLMTLKDPNFQSKISVFGGYNLHNCGDILFETP